MDEKQKMKKLVQIISDMYDMITSHEKACDNLVQKAMSKGSQTGMLVAQAQSSEWTKARWGLDDLLDKNEVNLSDLEEEYLDGNSDCERKDA